MQPRPSGEKIAAIAEKLDLKKNVVRVSDVDGDDGDDDDDDDEDGGGEDDNDFGFWILSKNGYF